MDLVIINKTRNHEHMYILQAVLTYTNYFKKLEVNKIQNSYCKPYTNLRSQLSKQLIV